LQHTRLVNTAPWVHALLSVSCQFSAKFGTCTVVVLNGTLVEAKMFTFNVRILSSTSARFRPTTALVPNLALV
jgi:hypothetical protein